MQNRNTSWLCLFTLFCGFLTKPAAAGTENAPYLQDSSGAEVGNASNPIRVDPTGTTSQPTKLVDISPAAQTIIALDTATTTFVGANSQNFYAGTPTTNSTASFTLSSIDTVTVEASLIGTGGTMFVEASMDGGAFWFRCFVYQFGTQSYANGFTSPFAGLISVAGMTNIRVRSAVSWSGTATITVHESLNPRAMIISSALPAGANTIGSIANISGTVSLPTLAATSTNQATEITSVQILDDVPAALNAAFVKGETAMGQLDDTSTTAATEDNVAPVRITAQRAEHVNLRNVSGTEVGTAAAPIRNDPTGTTTQPVNQGITTGGLYGAVTIGTTAVELKVGASRLTARRLVTAVSVDGDCYWGYSNAVVSTTGTPLYKNQVLTVSTKDENPPLWAICTTAGRSVRVTESP